MQKVSVSIDGTDCSAAPGISHTYVEDLVISLRSPAGTQVTLINHVGESGDHLCQVVLDDESAGPSIQTVTRESAPFTGTYKPNASLSAFAGEAANGNWSLVAQDYSSIDVGSIRAWSIHITPRQPSADLTVTKTDGVTIATPGGSVTYTITASNAGPDAVTGAQVSEILPPAITGAIWTCVGAGGGTCTTSGSGNINDTVNLPVGASATYTVSATINASATGTLTNTATITPPSGVTDPTPGNNRATDVDTLTPQADLAITMTDGVANAAPGGSVTYTITASNAGPSNATGATVADTFPAALIATWTCVGVGGGTCTASGSGNINDTVNLPVGASATYTVAATISASATGTLINTATITPHLGVTDPTPVNNSATDTDSLTPLATLAITPINLPSGQVQQAYPATSLAAAGGTGTLQWLAISGLPAGMDLSTSGVLSGTPSAAGSYNVVVQVTDSRTPTVQKHTATLALGIAAADLTVATPSSLPSATVGMAYSAALQVSGGTAPYRFVVVSGQLPAGLVLDAHTGAISGTPTTAETANFTITISDSTVATKAGVVAKAMPVGSVTLPFSITVAAATAAAPTPVPTLHHLALALLSLMAGGMGMLGLQWRKRG